MIEAGEEAECAEVWLRKVLKEKPGVRWGKVLKLKPGVRWGKVLKLKPVERWREVYQYTQDVKPVKDEEHLPWMST